VANSFFSTHSLKVRSLRQHFCRVTDIARHYCGHMFFEQDTYASIAATEMHGY